MWFESTGFHIYIHTVGDALTTGKLEMASKNDDNVDDNVSDNMDEDDYNAAEAMQEEKEIIPNEDEDPEMMEEATSEDERMEREEQDVMAQKNEEDPNLDKLDKIVEDSFQAVTHSSFAEKWEELQYLTVNPEGKVIPLQDFALHIKDMEQVPWVTFWMEKQLMYFSGIVPTPEGVRLKGDSPDKNTSPLIRKIDRYIDRAKDCALKSICLLSAIAIKSSFQKVDGLVSEKEDATVLAEKMFQAVKSTAKNPKNLEDYRLTMLTSWIYSLIRFVLDKRDILNEIREAIKTGDEEFLQNT